VVPYAPGGPTDVAARLLAEGLSATLPQRVIVENRTGAGTVVDTGAVANLPFDPVEDFRGVTLMGTVPQVVLVNRDLPARTFTELLDLFRSRPGELAYGSAGNGSAEHLASELLNSTHAACRPAAGRRCTLPRRPVTAR
jgi:tripartite-type tricarboxylate transporter receptor subunit TctC